jgi:hypothetical protein
LIRQHGYGFAAQKPGVHQLIVLGLSALARGGHCRYAAEFHADKRRDSDEEMLAALDVNIPNYATAEGQKYTAS